MTACTQDPAKLVNACVLTANVVNSSFPVDIWSGTHPNGWAGALL